MSPDIANTDHHQMSSASPVNQLELTQSQGQEKILKTEFAVLRKVTSEMDDPFKQMLDPFFLNSEQK